MRTSGPGAAVLVLLAAGAAGCSFQGSVRTASPTSSPPGPAPSHTTSPRASRSPSALPSPAPTSPSPSVSASPTAGRPSPSASVDRCHTSQLSGRVAPDSPQGGRQRATLTLRNIGGVTCTVRGYGGLGLVAADGAAVPTDQERIDSGGVQTVLLRPDQRAAAALSWKSTDDSGDCPAAAAVLRVIPPDETDHLSLTWALGPVCDAGRIAQSPYRPA